jgi:LytR cell envelope-related transcriptional attenuator
MPGGISPVRAFLVLVLFVVAAVVLVAVGTRPSVSGVAAAPATTTTTVPHHKTAPTTTTTTVPHASVSVVVANATQTNALAAHYSTVLSGQGWNVGTPVDATTTEATSSVYYAAGYQESATVVATELGIKPTAVVALTTAVPVSSTSGTDVVVVIGSDLVTTTTT